jgi:arginase
MRSRGGKVAVFGVPSAAGGSGPGMERGPFALRNAGLLEALRAGGRSVVNLSDLSLFSFEEGSGNARNVAKAACAAKATADEMTRALGEGFAVVLGGDCSLVVGAVAGVYQARGGPVGLVYLDANADLNTPDTSPSGRLAGMALALALGRGPEELVSIAHPPVDPDHVSLVGFRALDPGERSRIADLGLALPAAASRTLGMRATAALALDGVNNGDGPVLVHLDVDLVGPEQMPAKATLTPGQGLSWDEASALLVALAASPRVVALEVAEFDPSKDPDGASARRVVDLIVRAVHAREGRLSAPRG